MFLFTRCWFFYYPLVEGFSQILFYWLGRKLLLFFFSFHQNFFYSRTYILMYNKYIYCTRKAIQKICRKIHVKKRQLFRYLKNVDKRDKSVFTNQYIKGELISLGEIYTGWSNSFPLLSNSNGGNEREREMGTTSHQIIGSVSKSLWWDEQRDI